MARWRERLRVFLFPTETDRWLGLLRIGLGLQVVFYALSLRADWNYLFAGPGEGLIGRALPEALLSTESPLIPRLGWLVTLTTRTGFSESTALSIVWWVLLFAGCCLLSDSSLAHQQFWPGSFIFVRLKAEDSSPMESTTS